MIQAVQAIAAHYAVRFEDNAAPGMRVPRARQSAAAAALLDALRNHLGLGQDAACSKAHARTCVAAAVAPAGFVGIDVEYRAPQRDIGAIARLLLNADARDETAAYRVFTFREAYFKGCGVWPERALLRAVAEATEDAYVLGGVRVLHADLGARFVLSLVHSGGEAVRVTL